jgi:Flp pilus assembly protein TadD
MCLVLALLEIGRLQAHAEGAPVPRDQPASGFVVSRATGEVVRFVAEQAFRDLLVGQDLLAGDLIRTGERGALSLLFVNRTVMRLHPNTELLVKSVEAQSATLAMTSGLVWARTPREAEGDIVVETPSAAAAIRGTDWSLAVDADEVTRLTVFDGEAELANPLGAVRVPAGAAGLARPGQPPVLVQVANLREREQMLFTLTAPMAAASLARAVEKIVPGEAPAPLRSAMTAFATGDFARAEAIMQSAAPALDSERAAAARWIAAFARAAGGAPIEAPEPGAALMDVLGRAHLAAYSGDLDTAARVLAGAGEVPVALMAAVEVALYRDRKDEAAALLARLQSVAPGTPEALSAEAEVEFIARGNDLAAAELLRRAVALDPDDPELWNDLALAEYGVGNPIEAEAAVRRAIALAPGAPHSLSNLSIILLDQYRHEEVRPVIHRLLAMDPGSFLGLRAAARLAIQEGRDADAMTTGLAAVAAQPAAAESSIMLAIAAWQAGDRTRAVQELDAAERLDPNDPVVPVVRTVIALDEARADDAIRAALETERLYRLNQTARRLAADRASGSYVVEAFSNIGLDDWARDVADRTFDPLSAASLFSESLTPRPTIAGADDPIENALGSSLVQGLLLEPLSVAGRIRHADLLRRPFLDAEVTGQWGFGDPEGFTLDATVQGFMATPAPVSYALSLSGGELEGDRVNDESDARSMVALVGSQPSSRFGAFGFVSLTKRNEEFPGPVTAPTPIDNDIADNQAAGAGFTVRLEERSVLTGFAATTFGEEDSDIQRFALTPFTLLQFDIEGRERTDSQFVGIGWRSDDADGSSFAGIEGARVGQRARLFTTITDLLTGASVSGGLRESDETFAGRAYLDRRFQLGGRFDVAAELGLSAVAIDDGDAFPLSPRLGIGATLAPGQRVRAALVHETNVGGLTLGPVTTLGLVPVAAPIQPGGETAAAIFRYDGTFGDRLHVSLEHQSVRYEDLLFDARDLLGGVPVGKGVLHRAELAANAWLGWGVGAFASVAIAESEITDGPGDGFGMPTVPEREARFGLSWVHPAQIRATLEERYIGERAGDIAGTKLDDVWTTDASLFWEPFDKRLRVGVEALNIFDADVEHAFDQGILGRSVWLSGSVRF